MKIRIYQDEWLQKDGKYKCPYCDKKFTKRGIGNHIIQVHEGRGGKNKPKVNELIRRYKISQTNKIKGIGGYRRGSGRGKSGWYKGYWCDSTWELAFVIYHLDHKMPFKRNKKGFEYIWEEKKHLYYPDFVYPDGTYVEVKGRKRNKIGKFNNIKIKQFSHNIILLCEEEMKNMLYYCSLKYGHSLEFLYDNIKKNKIKNIYNNSNKNDKLIDRIWNKEIKKQEKLIKKEKIINKRLKQIHDIDLMKYGWVKKVSDRLKITHTHARRFIDKYYDGKVYKRKTARSTV
jgi:hypothetical protein